MEHLKHIKRFNEREEAEREGGILYSTRESEENLTSGSKIKRLKDIKEAGLTDLVDGKNLVWLMKKIIIDQNNRIEELEFKVAELRGEVEED